MEQITANIITFRNEVIKHKELKPVSGYLYNIGGLTVILHEDCYKPGTYTCSEYFTGRTLVRQLPDMQKALDDVTKRITEVTEASAASAIADVVASDGYANQPEG